MSITTKNKANADVVYSLYRTSGNRSTFIGPNHTDSSKDQCVFNQTDPVTSKNESGYRRTSCEFLSTVPITETSGVVKKIGRVSVSSSLPVGMPEGEIDELFARACEVAKQGAQKKNFFILGVRPV